MRIRMLRNKKKWRVREHTDYIALAEARANNRTIRTGKVEVYAKANKSYVEMHLYGFFSLSLSPWQVVFDAGNCSFPFAVFI